MAHKPTERHSPPGLDHCLPGLVLFSEHATTSECPPTLLPHTPRRWMVHMAFQCSTWQLEHDNNHKSSEEFPTNRALKLFDLRLPTTVYTCLQALEPDHGVFPTHLRETLGFDVMKVHGEKARILTLHIVRQAELFARIETCLKPTSKENSLPSPGLAWISRKGRYFL